MVAGGFEEILVLLRNDGAGGALRNDGAGRVCSVARVFARETAEWFVTAANLLLIRIGQTDTATMATISSATARTLVSSSFRLITHRRLTVDAGELG